MKNSVFKQTEPPGDVPPHAASESNGKKSNTGFENALGGQGVGQQLKPDPLRSNIEYWQNRILHALLLLALVAGIFTVVPSVWLSIKEQLYFVAAFDALMYASVVIVYFGEGIPYRIKAVFLSGLCFAIGIVLLAVVGPFGGGGPVWLFVFPIVTIVLLGNKPAMVAICINTIALIIVGLGIHRGIVENWDTAAPNPMAKWVVVSINFLFLNLLATLSLSTVLGGLRSALRDQSGLIHYLSIENDGKRRVVDQLDRSEKRYRRLFNEAPVMYVIAEAKNGEPCIKDVNNLCLSKLGCKRADLVGQPLARIYSVESQKYLKSENFSRALYGKLNGVERTLVTADGRKLDTTLHAVSDFDENDRIKGSLAMYVDITERKQAEAHARELEADLQRTQRSEAIGVLAGGIAHDFNNILSAVLGYAQICLYKIQETNPIYPKIKAIHDSGQRARQLVQQILTFTRDNEKQRVPVDIGPMIKEVCKMLRASLPATIDLKQQIPSGLPSVLADATQIHQIIMNLSTNAAHAMEKEGGTLRISARHIVLQEGDHQVDQELKPGSYISLLVEDDGCGIQPDSLSRIFDPYFTTKEQGEGTGLGLAVVHGIVKSYEGAIQVRSEPGRGTAMAVFLPTALPAAEAAVAPAPAAKPIPRGDEHILLVDDEQMVLDVAATMLGNLGYRVTAVDSGAEAMQRFAAAPESFDLLLLDMTMPKTNGDQLAARMRDIRPDIPVIFITGYSKRLVNGSTDAPGGDPVVFKPFEQIDLARSVRDTLDRVSATQKPSGEAA